MIAQLALELDPADALDLGHAAEVLAAETPPGRQPKTCRCTRPLPWPDGDCAMCGRLIPDNPQPRRNRGKGRREA